MAADTNVVDRRRGSAPWIVAAMGVVLFLVVAGLIRWWDRDNEQRLLQQQTDQAGVVLTVSINQFLDPLGAIAQVAELTDGDPALFDAMASELRSAADPTPYTRMALIDAETGGIEAVAGGPESALVLDAPAISELLGRTDARSARVVDMLDPARTLGFAVAGPTGRMVVYTERELNTDPNVRRRTDGPFGRVDYAIYLGSATDEARLLGASTTGTPLAGTTASTTVDYGDTEILLVTSPIDRLGSPWLGHLWWIVFVVGICVTALTTALLAGMLRSRERALDLAERNDRLHHQQRDIAETLQLELLPQHLSPPPMTRLATRYWVADTASLIGGDFYDSFQIDEHRWGILIGDVCGKGTPAAALTGVVRHTVRTASRFTDSPAAVLRAVHEAVATHQPPTFCTAALMLYTPDTADDPATGGELVISLGGHPPPLHRRGDRVTALGRTGTLLGMLEPTLHDERVRLDPGDIVLAYTDGLTDAPGGRGLSTDDLADALRSSDDIEQIAADVRRRHAVRAGTQTDDTAVLLLHLAGLGDRPDVQPAATAGTIETTETTAVGTT
jgi:serine phosphatase RsbU (regulator of sigma subunit)